MPVFNSKSPGWGFDMGVREWKIYDGFNYSTHAHYTKKLKSHHFCITWKHGMLHFVTPTIIWTYASLCGRVEHELNVLALFHCCVFACAIAFEIIF